MSQPLKGSVRPTLVDAGEPAALQLAVTRLKAGELVAFPTETVYGLGADARDPVAVGRIYTLKGRPNSHPLIVHLANASELEDWALEPSREALLLAEAMWPGPLTLVVRRSPWVADAVTGGQETVALRVPGHPVAAALLAAFGSGVAAPSANRFGRVSPTRAEHVAAEFAEADLLILDGGPCEVGVESTIVDLSGAEPGAAPRLLRPGGVAAAEIEELLGRELLRPHTPAGARAFSSRAASASVESLTAVDRSDSDRVVVPRVPGSLTSHYAANAPSHLVSRAELTSAALAVPGSAVLARRQAPEGFNGTWLQLPDEPVDYARELYAALREADATAPAQILLEAAPSGDAWLAVRDRLDRATAAAPAEPSSGGRIDLPDAGRSGQADGDDTEERMSA